MRKVCCSTVADFLDWVNSEAKKPPCDQRLCLYDQRQILAYKLQQDRWEGRLTQNSFINNKTPGCFCPRPKPTNSVGTRGCLCVLDQLCMISGVFVSFNNVVLSVVSHIRAPVPISDTPWSVPCQPVAARFIPSTDIWTVQLQRDLKNEI